MDNTEDPHIAESVINSVLMSMNDNDCHTDANDTESAKGGSIFKDGLTLIEAFKSQKSIRQASILSTPLSSQEKERQKWQIWYWKRGNTDTKSWKESLQQKSSFITRKEFWSAYDDVKGYEFSLMSRHFDYLVFKEGVTPMWEDSHNTGGGRWILEFPRKRDWRHMSYLDQIWLKLLLAITGDDDPLCDFIDEICGVVLMIRYNTNKIAIWTRNANNTLVNLKIGEQVKASTGFKGRMYYMAHDSTIKKIEVKAEPNVNAVSK